MSNTAKTVYERRDLLKQARKEIRPSLPFKAVPYALFFLFALYVDLKSLGVTSVPVQVRLAAPMKECRFYGILFLFSD